MNWSEHGFRTGQARGRAGLAALLCGLSCAGLPARAAVQVPGPMQVGPSWAQADAAHATALLSTVIVNHGALPDRLIRVECPASGHVALRNGTLHDDIATPTASQQAEAEATTRTQNGLDTPPALHGQPHPVTALIDLTQATQPLTDGALVPCTVTFAHSGEQVVIFTVGEQPTPTDEP